MSESPIDIFLSFDDLQAMKIVLNWETLGRWQNDSKIRFPKGRLLGPNSRRWSLKHDIEPWLASRPIAPKVTPKSPGRPRKQSKQETAAA